MEEHLIILPHAYKHGLTEEEICYAWNHADYRIHRNRDMRGDVYLVFGPTNRYSYAMSQNRKTLEYCAGLLAGRKAGNTFLVFHARRPPVSSLIKEFEEWKRRNS